MPHSLSVAGINHIILTRFNLPSKGRESKIRQSPNWLAHRFELFETYCLPSMLQQSNQDFKWFIYFDKDTPEPFRSRAKRYEQSHNQIMLFWETNLSLQKVRQQILSLCDNQKELLLTTRLDNDDALNKNFVKETQIVATKLKRIDHPQVINYPSGLILSNSRAYSHYDASNPFASLLEPLSPNVQTIWHHQHTLLYKFGMTHQIETPAMWLQIVHSNNVSNRVKGYRVKNTVLTNGFPLNQQQFNQEVRWLIILENMILYPARQLKEYFIKGLKALLYISKKKS